MRRAVPLSRRSDRAGERREPDENGIASVRFAHELPDVQLATLAHFGCARIAEMRIVRPDDDARFRPGALEKFDQIVQRCHHVTIPQIPGFDPTGKHRPVILLRIAYEPGILFRIEEIVGRDASVTARVFEAAAMQLHQLTDHFALA